MAFCHCPAPLLKDVGTSAPEVSIPTGRAHKKAGVVCTDLGRVQNREESPSLSQRT